MLVQSAWQTPAWALVVLVIGMLLNLGLSIILLLVKGNGTLSRELMTAKLDAMSAKIDNIGTHTSNVDRELGQVRDELQKQALRYEQRFARIEGRLGIERANDRRNGEGHSG